MSEKKSWGSTVLGWFVEREGEESQPNMTLVEDENRAEAANPVELKGELPLPADANSAIDFSAIFRAAGIEPDAQGRVDKALALLKTLPAETPKDVKRQIVEASLKAFGYPIEQIIAAGVSEINALHAFISFSQRDTQKTLAESNTRIEALNKEITEIKTLMEKKSQAQQALTNQCNQQKLSVQEVLEFFGQDVVERVVRESPKPSK